jgi:hypothetical protein
MASAVASRSIQVVGANTPRSVAIVDNGTSGGIEQRYRRRLPGAGVVTGDVALTVIGLVEREPGDSRNSVIIDDLWRWLGMLQLGTAWSPARPGVKRSPSAGLHDFNPACRWPPNHVVRPPTITCGPSKTPWLVHETSEGLR